MTANRVAYWGCQVVGWGAYSALGAGISAQYTGWRPAVVIGYPLFFLYTVALTHGLRGIIQQRQWISLPLWRLVPRLVLASISVGTIQTVLIAAGQFVVDPSLTPPGETRYWSTWIGVVAADSLWITLYVAVVTARRYREARYHALKLELALREAELRALEAQVNPHFLFNALNTIRGSIAEDPGRAQEMVTRLAGMLRYSLTRDRQHTVPLAHELAAVQDYLALESARFEERLQVRFAVDEAALSRPIPAMLLQTLVENALKHGIAPLPAGGEVLVRAAVQPDGLLLEVENSGQLAAPSAGTTQLGLHNARERLRVLYGDRASLHLASPGHGRVLATVRIPEAA